MSKSILGCLVLVAGLFGTAHARDTEAKSDADARYTFSWPLDTTERKPRGGMSKGAPVKLAVSPAREWVALQAPGLTQFERDRRAILAMTGTYRVTFDFLEVVPFVAGQERRPYQSWGTEKVYVDRDAGGTISLVHILEMRVLNDDGSISEPMVTKHWRQDWQYEPKHIVEYQGRERWQRRAVTAKEAKGRAREYGMARYERIEGEFAAADQYYAATKPFWDEVRGTWTDAFAKQGTITLQGPVDKLGLFQPLFSYADAVQSGTAQGDAQSVIHVALREMGALR